MKITVVNFADETFKKQQDYNTKTAFRRAEADRVFSFSPKDIDCDFFEKNKSILSNSRGAGLWLWKPYFIKKSLDMIEYGDYLFYCDSGAYFINRLDHLVDSLELANQDIMGFVLPLLERQFTKKEAFVLMEFSDYSLNQVLSTYILFKKTDFTIQFVNEWLAYCCDQRIICPEHYLENVNEFEDFVSHREDQSVFSVLYHKYNLRAFKDPSQFGERPWEYSWRLKFATWSNRWIYRPVLTERSPYRKILVLYRRNKFLSFRIFEYMKNLLFILGIYNQHTFALIIKQGRSGGASLL